MSARVRPTPVDARITKAIDSATTKGLDSILGVSPTAAEARLIIKYMDARYGGEYAPARRTRGRKARDKVHISTSVDFTWGTGCYVCPLAYAFSAAIYGSCGIIAEFDPSHWRLFDAGAAQNIRDYMAWVEYQPMIMMLKTTVHANLANQYLRNTFREAFRIDCVVFPPDEINQHYVDRTRHRWLAVSDWDGPGRLRRGGASDKFRRPRLTVVIAEQFEKVHGGLGRRTLIGPQASPFVPPATPAQLAAAYVNHQICTTSP